MNSPLSHIIIIVTVNINQDSLWLIGSFDSLCSKQSGTLPQLSSHVSSTSDVKKNFKICGVFILRTDIYLRQVNGSMYQSCLWFARIRWLANLIFDNRCALQLVLWLVWLVGFVWFVVLYLTPGVPCDWCKAFSSHLASPHSTPSQIGEHIMYCTVVTNSSQ